MDPYTHIEAVAPCLDECEVYQGVQAKTSKGMTKTAHPYINGI
jgi:hypothetical protein